MRLAPGTSGLTQLLAGRHQVFARVHEAGRHPSLCGLAPGAQVVVLLPADVAIDLEHAVVADEHMTSDRPGERVLSVSVDVHLDYAVGDGLAYLLERGARAAVKHQVERAWLAESGASRVLCLPQDRRPELDVNWLADPRHHA